MKNVLRVVLPLAVLSVGAGGAATLVALRPEVEPESPTITPPLVDTTTARRADVSLSVRAHGTVVPRTESRLVSEVAGRVRSVSPSWADGGFFEEGELLLEIDPTDYLLAEKEAAQRVARAELVLAQEEAEADVARKDWEAMHGDEPAPPLVVREPQVREARASLDAALALHAKAKRDVERCRVVAPYAGRVRSKSADVGTYAQPGSELGHVYGTDAAEVRLPLPDAELAYLDLALDARGHVPPETMPDVQLKARFAGRELTWHGRIVRTESELAPKSRMVVLVCHVPDPYGRGERTDRPPLAVGMFVEAVIEGLGVEGALALPRHALRSGDRVFVAEGDRLRFRDVELLRTEQDRVLLRGGLEPGERVVLTPLETPVDGMRIRTEPDA